MNCQFTFIWLVSSLFCAINCEHSCHASRKSNEHKSETTFFDKDEGDCKKKPSVWKSVDYEDMALLPAGSFFMGTNEPIIPADGEGPERSVTVGAFWMDIHEVRHYALVSLLTFTIVLFLG